MDDKAGVREDTEPNTPPPTPDDLVPPPRQAPIMYARPINPNIYDPPETPNEATRDHRNATRSHDEVSVGQEVIRNQGAVDGDQTEFTFQSGVIGHLSEDEKGHTEVNIEVRPESGVSLGTAFPPYDPRESVAAGTPSSAANPGFMIENDGRKRVVVLGSGDFGLALTTRLAQANYRVIVASRNPNRTRERVMECGGIMMTQGEALGEDWSGGVVIVAVPAQHHSSLPLNLLNGKILVDVSNRNPKERKMESKSHAESLQSLVPGARVVKAMNVLSAYALSRGDSGTRKVPVCSDDETARSLVCSMVRDMGFDALERGRLANAREVEMIPLRFFPEWKFAFLVSLIVWLLTFFLTFVQWELCPTLRATEHNKSVKPDWSVLETLPTGNVSVACATTSITLLALCYLPGVLAGYLQLWRGTKYSEFPNWLDKWLKGRKQLGLLMLLHACVHATYAVALNGGGSSGWRHPTFIATGIIAMVLACILGLSSLPSVSSSMTWREFMFVQSRLGWFTLVLAVLHVIFYEWDGLISNDFECSLPSIGQFLIVIPLLTVALKLPLLLPCVDSALTNIRQGYERVSVKAEV